MSTFFIFASIILFFLVLIYIKNFNNDQFDLEGTSLEAKFSIIINKLNNVAFRGGGKIKNFDKRQLNIYQEGSNQLIQFSYSTGSLSITWKYKYFQKEVIYSKTFDNVRNLSVFEQGQIADSMINQMSNVVEKHKANVLKEFPSLSSEVKKQSYVEQNDIQKENKINDPILSDTINKKYHIIKEGVQLGEFTVEEIRVNSNINREVLVWTEGMIDWKIITEVEELKDCLNKIPPPPPSYQTKQKSNKLKVYTPQYITRGFVLIAVLIIAIMITPYYQSLALVILFVARILTAIEVYRRAKLYEINSTWWTFFALLSPILTSFFFAFAIPKKNKTY